MFRFKNVSYEYIDTNQKTVTLFEHYNNTFLSGEVNVIVCHTTEDLDQIKNLLCGFTLPISGTIFIDDVDYASLAEKQKRDFLSKRFVYIKGDSYLPQHETPSRLIKQSLNKKHMSKRFKAKLSDRLIEEIGMSGYDDWQIHELLYGHPQKVAILVGIANNVDHYVFEENLDIENDDYDYFHTTKICEYLGERNKTMVILSTNPDYSQFAHNCIDLRNQSPYYWGLHILDKHYTYNFLADIDI